MGNLVSLAEWAKKNGIDPATARQRAGRGAFDTARKIGRNWVIDEEEKLIDHRRRIMSRVIVKDYSSNVEIYVDNEMILNESGDGYSDYSYDENIEGLRDKLNDLLYESSDVSAKEVLENETLKNWVYFQSSDVRGDN